MTNSKTPPKYNVAIVEAVILEVAAELHPEHLSAHELSLKIISDPNDSRELETAGLAIDWLRKFGLFKTRDDEIAEPTAAALHAVALLS